MQEHGIRRSRNIRWFFVYSDGGLVKPHRGHEEAWTKAEAGGRNSVRLPHHISMKSINESSPSRWGAGGDASVAELESAGTRDPRWLIDRANAFLDAGAHVCSSLFEHDFINDPLIGTDDHDRERRHYREREILAHRRYLCHHVISSC